MKIVTPIAGSALGAGVTGVAAGLIALSAVQAHLPSLMARVMKPVPDLAGKRVLVCTGHVDSALRGTTRDPAQEWQRVIEAEHEISTVMVDLRVGPQASARIRARAEALAQEVRSDHRRDFPRQDPIGSHRGIRTPETPLTARP